MTTDEMIANLRSLLGNINSAIIDTQILTELKLAQTELEHGVTLPWFLLTEATALTVAGEARIAVPTDFIREYEEGGLFYVNSDGLYSLLDKGFKDQVHLYWNKDGTEDEDTKGPRAYTLTNGYFFLFPTPQAVYTLRMHYYATDTVLATGDSGNLWSTHFPDLLMGKAGQNLCLHQGYLADGQQGPVLRFTEMVMNGERRLKTFNTARSMDNMELSYGGG